MKRSGLTLVELMLCMSLVACFSLAVIGFPQIAQRISETKEIPFAMLTIHHQFQNARYEAINALQRRSVLFPRNQQITQFKIDSSISFHIAPTGSIQLGGSITMKKNNVRYRVTIQPVTGKIGLQLGQRVIRFADLL
jgi:Tfp pilus assembly protein FimT